MNVLEWWLWRFDAWRQTRPCRRGGHEPIGPDLCMDGRWRYRCSRGCSWRLEADGPVPARGDVSRETSPPLSLKCRLYADRPHQPCSGTTDDGTDRSCSCICHVPTGYLRAFRVVFPCSTTNLSRDPDDPYDPDGDLPFTWQEPL